MSDGTKPTRRVALKVLGGTLVAGAFAYASRPIVEWASNQSLDDVLRKHYKELTREELAQVLHDLEAETKKLHGVDVHIEDIPPQEGVQFGYALSLWVCIGCRKCVEACHVENNHDRRTNNS